MSSEPQSRVARNPPPPTRYDKLSRPTCAAEATSRLLLGEEEVVLHVRAHLVEVLAVGVEATVVVAVLTTLKLAFEVIVPGSAILVAGGLAAMCDDLLHPPFLRLRGDVDGVMAVAARVVDTHRNVITLCLQHVGQVELKGRLVAAHDEQVGIALRVDTQHGADAAGVFVVQLASALPHDLVVNAGFLHLEAGRVDEYVEFVLLALEYRTLLVYFGNS